MNSETVGGLVRNTENRGPTFSKRFLELIYFIRLHQFVISAIQRCLSRKNPWEWRRTNENLSRDLSPAKKSETRALGQRVRRYWGLGTVEFAWSMGK